MTTIPSCFRQPRATATESQTVFRCNVYHFGPFLSALLTRHLRTERPHKGSDMNFGAKCTHKTELNYKNNQLRAGSFSFSRYHSGASYLHPAYFRIPALSVIKRRSQRRPGNSWVSSSVVRVVPKGTGYGDQCRTRYYLLVPGMDQIPIPTTSAHVPSACVNNRIRSILSRELSRASN